jgi:hypothetical protein
MHSCIGEVDHPCIHALARWISFAGLVYYLCFYLCFVAVGTTHASEERDPDHS